MYFEKTLEEKKQISNTILEQLGGNRFRMMTGARHFATGDKGELTFLLPIGRWIEVEILLTPADLYRVRFSRPRPAKAASLQESIHDDVYAEDLQSLFTRETGLDTHL